MSGSTSLVAPPLIEQIRSNHEEIERLEQFVMKELITEHLSPMKQLFQGHRLRRMTKSIILKTENLVETYAAAIPAETEPFQDQIALWTNVSYNFYSRLEQIYQYHGDFSSGRPFDADEDYEALLKDAPAIAFSVEEGFGRYLDLHAMYKLYINSDFGEKVEYSAYLDVFSQPEKIPREIKSSRNYSLYISQLLRYLIYFFLRTEPLRDLDRILYKVSTDLKEQYADVKVEGWGNHSREDELFPYHPVWNMQGLLDAGPEQVNEALGSLGLVTGGTLRLLADEMHCLTMHQHQMPQLLMEAQVKKLCDLLEETIERTKQNVKKKQQALAFEEMEEENPRKQAMGWDGEPIPYWLRKLGLGQEYKCEICRNRSYAGKRAFERHFKEGCHQARLGRLGIPESRRKFYGSTSIEEAKEVWNRKQNQAPAGPFLRRSKRRTLPEKKSNQAPAGVAIPPKDIRRVLERVAHVVSSTTLLEDDVIAMYEEDERLNFWKSSDPYHAFYQHKLAEYRAWNPDARRLQAELAAASKLLPPEYMVPPGPLEPHRFTYRLPEGITHKDLDIIKLAAEFWVRSGGCYFKGFSEREIRDHRLEFVKKPTDGRFSIFSKFVRGYSEVLTSSREIVIEKLRKNAADVETVLENCYHRLQWDRFQRELLERRSREDRAESPPRALRNWREMGPPGPGPRPRPQPQTEPTKRQKMIDEAELVPEDEFLAQHPGYAIINVSIPKFNDEYFEILVPSLLESVASLKEKMNLLMSVPVSKQKISGKTGLFKDNRSLAHYNVGPGEILIWSRVEENAVCSKNV